MTDIGSEMLEMLQALPENEKAVVAQALGIEAKQRETQSQQIVELALMQNIQLFHDPQMKAYASVAINGHKETWPVTSRGSGPFRNWLRQLFFQKYAKPPGNQAVQDAIGVLEAIASLEGAEYSTNIRIAQFYKKIYIDLADENWQAVEITPEGWKIIDSLKCPVKFLRTKGMLPLPKPKNSEIGELRRFLNISGDGFKLIVAWVLAALRPKGPYPILLLQGEQGTGKTTAARVLRELVDPCAAPVRTGPQDERDMMICASNNWILCYDNLSGVPVWLSDALCRLSTGGGFSTRQLYSDDEEIIIDACRPVILTGINEIANRHDLLDRCLIVNLQPISEQERKDETGFWREFEEARPRIFGALLTAVSRGLKNFNNIKLDKMPRMADFAKWVCACEEALPWNRGGFMAAYAENRENAVCSALEGDVVANAVRLLLEERGEWEGTAQELLDALAVFADEKTLRSKTWPANPRSLANKLRRDATFLRQTGIDIQFVRQNHSGKRLVVLRVAQKGDAGDADKNFASPVEALIFKAGDEGDAGDDVLYSESKEEKIEGVM